ncbi:hypothetical protein NPIL_668081 [Nephila pilipes]|uniref:Uncharacterized protein n=1 Tax=Nephila pilipes TaxID=299642 RepID=A0A8X6MRF9_NEPPI|nr:hypothetical protein NPIL_668081 [Nephila pilipes]
MIGLQPEALAEGISTDESDAVSVSLKASCSLYFGGWYHDRYPFHTRLNRMSTANCVLDLENRDRLFHHPNQYLRHLTLLKIF